MGVGQPTVVRRPGTDADEGTLGRIRLTEFVVTPAHDASIGIDGTCMFFVAPWPISVACPSTISSILWLLLLEEEESTREDKEENGTEQ